MEGGGWSLQILAGADLGNALLEHEPLAEERLELDPPCIARKRRELDLHCIVEGGVRIHPENARMSGRHGVQYVAQCVACAALTPVVWQ